MTNALMAIRPYWDDNLKTWVFDDPAVDLVREPFVCGADKIIDDMVEIAEIPHAHEGFRCIFSAGPFPGARKFVKLSMEDGGAWYEDTSTGKHGWLCPATLKYFPVHPDELYVKAEALA